MVRIWKGLAALALAGSSFALYGASAASATGPGDSFTMTLASKATYTTSYRTTINVTGTYTCTIATGWTPDPNYSGLNANVSQIQGKTVVQGGSGSGGTEFPICDGQAHAWTVQVQANAPDGSSATWKNGKAIVNVGGNVADGFDCGGMGGPGTSNCMGAQVTQTVKIS